MDLSDALDQYVRRVIHEELVVIKPQTRFISKDKLACLLGVQPRTIKTWRAKGLPGIRVGREVMFEIAAVERWIERHT